MELLRGRNQGERGLRRPLLRISGRPWASTLRGAVRILGRPGVQDGLTAGALTAAALGGLFAQLDVNVLDGDGEVFERLDRFGIGLVLFQTAPLALRRRVPVVALGVTATALVAFSLLHYPPSLGSFGFLACVYTVAAHPDRRTSIGAGVVGAAVVLVILAGWRQPVAPDTLVADYVIVGAAWFFGESLRLRRRYVVALEDRATRLEHQQEERARAAVAHERRVIARELHDVVAHNVSVIVAQSAAARRVFESQPQDGLDALRCIERTGRAALVEMRRLTGFLRTDAEGVPETSPQPGLQDLDTLIAQIREAGVAVTVRTVGDPRPIPAGLDLSAFRIVQESLTNVLKHAGPARAEVLIGYGPGCLELTITDDGGRRGAASRPGFGHLGMRERTALFGGELRVGPLAGSGYRVHASLPLEV